MTYGGSTIYQHNYLCNLPLLPIFHTDWILVQLCNVRLNMMSSFIIFAHTWCLQRISMKAPQLHLKDIYKQTNKKHYRHTTPKKTVCNSHKPLLISRFAKLIFPNIPFLRLLEAAGDMISPTQPKHWGEIPSKHTWVPPIFSPTVPGTFESMIFLFPSWDMFFFLRSLRRVM